MRTPPPRGRAPGSLATSVDRGRQHAPPVLRALDVAAPSRRSAAARRRALRIVEPAEHKRRTTPCTAGVSVDGTHEVRYIFCGNEARVHPTSKRSHESRRLQGAGSPDSPHGGRRSEQTCSLRLRTRQEAAWNAGESVEASQGSARCWYRQAPQGRREDDVRARAPVRQAAHALHRGHLALFDGRRRMQARTSAGDAYAEALKKLIETWKEEPARRRVLSRLTPVPLVCPSSLSARHRRASCPSYHCAPGRRPGSP